jgi:uncharacterized protein YxeA
MMLRFLGRACIFLFGVLKVALITATLGAAIFVIMNAAMLEANYYAKYENAFQRMEHGHQRNLIVGEMVQSQMAWERAGEGLRQAYSDERANRIKIQKQLEIRQYEFYAFLKVLEKKYPGATQAVLEELSPGPIIRQPNQPTPAVPRRQRSILKDHSA